MDPITQFLAEYDFTQADYLGDGAYAAIDQDGNIVLITERDNGINWVMLGPNELDALDIYRTWVKSFVLPPCPTDT